MISLVYENVNVILNQFPWFKLMLPSMLSCWTQSIQINDKTFYLQHDSNEDKKSYKIKVEEWVEQKNQSH